MNEDTDRNPDRFSPFSDSLGIRLIAAGTEEVLLSMPATPALANRNGVLHGGALLGMADHAGGTLTIMNLAPGQATTTIESKTNFLRPIRIGDTAQGRAVALHKGRTTMVVQTTITRDDGKVAAIVTQTQMIMEWRDPA